MSRLYMDDNFGAWHDMDDPDTRDFYRQVQKELRLKKCHGCGRKVRIRPQYAYCNSCADKREQGWDL